MVSRNPEAPESGRAPDERSLDPEVEQNPSFCATRFILAMAGMAKRKEAMERYLHQTAVDSRLFQAQPSPVKGA